MTREELLKCPEYWVAQIQCELYRRIENYMREHHMNKAQLAEHLGWSRGYVTQLLNGDFDHKISKLAELSLAMGLAPQINFTELSEVDGQDRFYDTMTIPLTPHIGTTQFVKMFPYRKEQADLSTEYSYASDCLCANVG